MAANLDLEKISGQIENVLPNNVTEDDRSRLRRMRDWVLKRRSEVMPWGDFFNSRKFSKPSNVAEVSSRVMSNVKLYQANYVIICILLAFYCVMTSPLLLIALTTLLGGCYIISTRNNGNVIKLFGREFSSTQQYGLVFLISLPLFFFASAGSAVFWIIGASIVIIGLHASLLSTSSAQVTDIEMESISLQ